MNAKQLQQKERELEKLRDRIRAKGYSLETERSYVPAVAKFIDFLCARSWPSGIPTERKVEAFLTAEAKRGVAASTQNAKFQAILFYYVHVRGERLENIDALRAKLSASEREAERLREALTTIDEAFAEGGFFDDGFARSTIRAALRGEEAPRE